MQLISRDARYSSAARMILLLLLASLAAPSASPAAGQPPNIILFLIDDLGWMDLGCQGSTFYETHNIDRLAAEGMRFTNAYAACPVCSPSRAALMSGKSPAKVRFTGHITAIFKHRYPAEGRIIPPDDNMFLPLDEVSLANALKPAGYASASIGKWHLGAEPYWPEKHGFDVNIASHTHGSPASYFFPYKDPSQEWNPDIPNLPGGALGEYLTDRLTDEALSFIEKQSEQPFFVYFSHYAVHKPIQAPEEVTRKYEAKLNKDDSQFDAAYAAMIERVDVSVGRVVDKLQELNLDQDTVLIFTSDNGGLSEVTRNAPLREGKGYLYEGGIRVPLIAKWPERIQAGAVTDEPVIGTDLYPTIVDMAGEKAQSGKGVEGRSLLPLLTGKTSRIEHDLHWYYPHYSPQAQQPGAAIRSRSWKLIEHYDPPAVELFDLREDVGEKQNLAEQLPEKRDELLGKLHQWLQDVNALQHQRNPNAKR